MPEEKLNIRLFIGTKIIKAVWMCENEHRKSQGKPEVHEERQGYQVYYPDGYISWSPKEVFESAYREVTDAERELF